MRRLLKRTTGDGSNYDDHANDWGYCLGLAVMDLSGFMIRFERD
jgi:hypothetical protein